jgi:RimJ/RimL family protein N-acetyltransferase
MQFRPVQKSDASFISRVRNSVTHEFLHSTGTFTVEEVEQWLDTKYPFFYIIETNITKQPVGYFRLSDYNPNTNSIQIGADLAEEFRGLGLGYESYVEFMSFLEERFGIEIYLLQVLGTNQRALNLYKKLGFEIDKIEKNSIEKNGKRVDNIFMKKVKNG